MKIAISATNPCHLYDLALAWHAVGILASYHSGYPGWRLHPPLAFPLRAHATRTVITYAAMRVPRRLRPVDDTLFRWQDRGFDRSVSRSLSADDGQLIHALPGQALHTFKAAKRLGMETCLNHASGPLLRQHAILCQVARLTGSAPPRAPRLEEVERRATETMLADWHCVASTVVRSQLIEDGIPAERIWVAPYAAAADIFHPAHKARKPGRNIVFAGQITARKGLPVLAEALRLLGDRADITLDCYGPQAGDADTSWQRGDRRIRLHGAVSQRQLGERFREADLLVLPSWEEAFGLVVPQALACGIPVIVSDRVGAKDIITPRQNGSIFPAGDSTALAAEIQWWLDNPGAFECPHIDWREAADTLLSQIINRRSRTGAKQA